MADRVKRVPARARERAQPPPREAPGDAGSKSVAARLSVRPARRADVDAVTALDGGITGLAKPEHWLELYRRQGGSTAPSSKVIFLVATPAQHPERVLGFIVGEIRAWEFGSAPCGWVYALSVEPGARLSGVAETLLAAVAAEFRKAGMTKMRTMVARDNRLPMLFFRGEGMMAGPYIQLEKDLE
jgi:ribosomal protein S18 acetylase RimI-like enzyme